MAWAEPLASLIRAGVAEASGRPSEAAARLEEAERGFEAARMGLHAAAARRRRGEIVAGAGSLVASADEWMATHGVKNPARMAGMLAPRPAPQRSPT
jgi:eukaryotic-like serine/threonine-protein kinase